MWSTIDKSFYLGEKVPFQKVIHNYKNFWKKSAGSRACEEFLEMRPRAQSTKEKKKLDFIETKSFCFVKDNVKEDEKPSYKLGEILFAMTAHQDGKLIY